MAGIQRSEGGAQRFREEQRWPQGNTMLAKYSEVGRLAVNNNIYACHPSSSLSYLCREINVHVNKRIHDYRHTKFMTIVCILLILHNG